MGFGLANFYKNQHDKNVKYSTILSLYAKNDRFCVFFEQFYCDEGGGIFNLFMNFLNFTSAQLSS